MVIVVIVVVSVESAAIVSAVNAGVRGRPAATWLVRTFGPHDRSDYWKRPMISLFLLALAVVMLTPLVYGLVTDGGG